MSPGLISVDDGAAADCGPEIQNNILVHTRNHAPNFVSAFIRDNMDYGR